MLGLLFAGALYYRDTKLGDLSPASRWILASLRFLTVALITFFLLGPLLKSLETEIEPPIMVVGIDGSRSMVMGADSSDVRSKLPSITENLQRALGDKVEVVTYSFGQQVSEGADSSFGQPITDMAGFFTELRSRYDNRNLGAVILASDGIYNRGANPRYALSGIKAPIYTLAYGDTIQQRDALIAEAAANRIAFLGNKFPVEALLRAEKLKGNTLSYQIETGGVVIEKGSFIADSDRSEKTVRFLLDAKSTGLQRYVIRVATDGEEITLSNNERSVFVDIIDSRQKVLVLAKSPHPDLLALRQAISGNENYEVEVDFEFSFSSGKVSDYDLVILHQIPSATTPAALREEISRSKVPLFAILGLQSQLSQVVSMGLPVDPKISGQGSNDVSALVNPAFARFKIDPALDALLRDAPPLLTYFGESRISNSSETLLYQRVGNIKTDDPLLVVNNARNPKSAVLVGEGLWRWRLFDYAKHANHEIFDRFIGSIVQFLSLKDDKRLFRVSAPNDVMENERLVINAELYNAALEPVIDAEVSIELTDENEKTYPFNFSRSESAYRLDAGILPTGNYAFSATAIRDGKRYTETGNIAIRPFALEDANLTADHELLYAIAANTGGKRFYPNQLDGLVEEIQSAATIQPVSYSTEILSALINKKWPFFLLLILLSGEWFIRKRSGHY